MTEGETQKRTGKTVMTEGGTESGTHKRTEKEIVT